MIGFNNYMDTVESAAHHVFRLNTDRSCGLYDGKEVYFTDEFVRGVYCGLAAVHMMLGDKHRDPLKLMEDAMACGVRSEADWYEVHDRMRKRCSDD